MGGLGVVRVVMRLFFYIQRFYIQRDGADDSAAEPAGGDYD
jgi:hypothetical protein